MVAVTDLDQRIMGIIVKYEIGLDNFFLGRITPFVRPLEGEYDAPVGWFVNVSDTFYYACADAEEITIDNVHVFENVARWAAEHDLDYEAPLLFACYLRKRLPLPEIMKCDLYGSQDKNAKLFEELFETDLYSPPVDDTVTK